MRALADLHDWPPGVTLRMTIPQMMLYLEKPGGAPQQGRKAEQKLVRFPTMAAYNKWKADNAWRFASDKG